VLPPPPLLSVLMYRGSSDSNHYSIPSLRPVESHVIPEKAGIRFAQVDPRFRGGDDVYDFHFNAWAASSCAPRMPPAFISVSGPKVHGTLNARKHNFLP